MSALPSDHDIFNAVSHDASRVVWDSSASVKIDKTRALIASAVEKALAEREACYRREVLQAKIDTLDDLWHATKRDHSGKAVEVAFASHVTPSFIREEVDRLAAELAALEGGKP